MRKLAWISLLVLSVMLFAACTAVAPSTGTTTEAAPAAEAAPAEGDVYAGVDPSGQTVVWWHNHTGSRDAIVLELAERYNAENEFGITLDAQSQGGYNEIRDKVNASISAGEVPANIVVGYQNDQAFYQLNDTLVNFDDLINDPTFGLTEEEWNDFYPVFRSQSVHPLFGDARLGFPPQRSMEVMFYNGTVLSELGFDAPPTTPDEFVAQACAAAARDGDDTGGYVLRDDASAVASWTFAYGGDISNEDHTGYVLNGEATVAALTMLKQLYDDGCAYFLSEGFPNPELASGRALFTQGSTSGLSFYAGDIATFASENGTEPAEWGVVAIPHTTADPVQNIYGGDVMIVRGTPESEVAAWDFIKWFSSPEVMAEWNARTGYFPTRSAAAPLVDQYLTDETRVQYNAGLELLPYAAYEPQLLSYTAVRDEITKAFNEIMQGAPIQERLDALNTFANDQEAAMLAELQ